MRSVLPRVVKVGFKELNMINYFTCGPDEVFPHPFARIAESPRLKRLPESLESLCHITCRAASDSTPVSAWGRCARGPSTAAFWRRRLRVSSTAISNAASSRFEGNGVTFHL